MAAQCMLIETELDLHREVLVGVLRQQRPHLRIQTVHPDAPGEICECVTPQLLICSDKRLIDLLRPFAWILLFPNQEDVLRVGVGHSMKTLASATMDDVLAVIDQVFPDLLSAPAP